MLWVICIIPITYVIASVVMMIIGIRAIKRIEEK